MNSIAKLEAEEQKQSIYYQQGCRCFTCGRLLPYGKAEAAHRIKKGYVGMFGPEVIHHRKNIRITCPGKCNSAVLLNPWTIEGKALIAEIKEDLNGIDADNPA